MESASKENRNSVRIVRTICLLVIIVGAVIVGLHEYSKPPSSAIEQAIREETPNGSDIKITNQYTREFGGERWWIFEYEYGEGSEGHRFSKSVGIVKRGSKWYKDQD